MKRSRPRRCSWSEKAKPARGKDRKRRAILSKNMSSPTRFNNVRITNRLKWMISAIAQTFNIDEKIADSFVRERESQDVLEPFFQHNGPKRIIVFYQSLSPAKNSEPSLFFTDGTSDQLLGKACYFVRMVEEDVNTDVYCDNAVIY